MIRGCLVTIIYRKTTSISTLELDDAAAVSLMSTDVERIVTGLALMHDIWKTLLQIGIALFLLYRLVWAAFVVPLALFLSTVQSPLFDPMLLLLTLRVSSLWCGCQQPCWSSGCAAG
jgi:hypothetical protein